MVLLKNIVLWTVLLAYYAAFLLKVSTVCLIIHSCCSSLVYSSLKLLIAYIHLCRTRTILIMLSILNKSLIFILSIYVIWGRLYRLPTYSTSEIHHHIKKCLRLLISYLLHLDLFICKSWTILYIAAFYKLVQSSHWVVLKLLILLILASRSPRTIIILFHRI